MKKLLIMLTLLTGLKTSAQTNTFPSTGAAGIGTTTPDVSSLLEIKSTSKGLLISRMTRVQRDAITTPATGLLIYQTNNAPGFYYYDGSVWVAVSPKGVNKSLSNLIAPTALNVDLLPGTNDALSLGSTSFGWKNIYAVEGYFLGGNQFISNKGGGSFIGVEAGNNNISSNATAMGYQALYANTTGSANSAFGYQALNLNTFGSGNTANGFVALSKNTSGNYNAAFGSNALQSNQTGSSNSATGVSSMVYNTTGSYNTANGYGALLNNTTGSVNVAMGSGALYHNTVGSGLVAIGDSSLYNQSVNSLGYYANTAIGDRALFANTTGYANTATGYFALYTNTTGNGNTAYGKFDLRLNTTGSYNTAVGSDVLGSNTTGAYNTANGYTALYSNTTGSNNTAIGDGTLFANTTGAANSATGDGALYYNTTGNNNTANGYAALHVNTTGINNTALGVDALNNNTTGYSNTAAGEYSQPLTTTGWQNTSLGTNSLDNNTTGSYNTAIGYNTGNNGSNRVNTTCVGIDATATGDNMVRIGNTFVSSIGGQVGWTTLSDGRFKENIKENVPGLNFINMLRPVTYNINRDEVNDYTGVTTRKQVLAKKNPQEKFLSGDKYSHVTTGFIAQEVEQAAKKIGYDFSGVDAPKNEKDMYGLRYDEFVVPLVKAVQELSKQNDQIKQQNNIQQQEIDTLRTRLDKLESLVLSSQSSNANISSQQTHQDVMIAGTAKLEQNIPNPFSGLTTINYYLPVNNNNAYINFYSASGAVLKSVKITASGNGSINLKANELPSGNYRYTLLIDGKIIDSKQMMHAQ